MVVVGTGKRMLSTAPSPCALAVLRSGSIGLVDISFLKLVNQFFVVYLTHFWYR